MQKNVRRGLYGLMLVTVVILLLIPIRQLILHTAIQKAQLKVQNLKNLKLTIGDTDFMGIAGVHATQIILENASSDTLLKIDSLQLQLKIRELFKGNIRFATIMAKNLTLNFNDEWLTTHDILKDSLTTPKPQGKTTSFSRIVNRILKTTFSLVPNQMLIENIQVNYITPEHQMTMTSPRWVLKNHRMESQFSILKNGRTLPGFLLEGIFDDTRKFIEIRCSKGQEASTMVPVFEPLFGLEMQFDTLQFQVHFENCTSDKVSFSGQVNISQLSLQHSKLAMEPVCLIQGRFQFRAVVEKYAIVIDSSSRASINQVTFVPTIEFQGLPKPTLKMGILPFQMQAKDLLSSLPKGLFNSFQGMEIGGTIAYQFNFDIPFDTPDSLRLDSKVTAQDLAIYRYGTACLTMLNDTFTYPVYENGQYIRSIKVSPDNPHFVPLDKISPFLKHAVITSEDGGFFYHKGFDAEAIRHALADNLKKGRFARGGSTITMQLVKNVFLTQHKTLSRKMEEWMMVWLIENLNLTSKERLFEVYLNVIEWGPNVYGIYEASEFYFAKDPNTLTLNESIFLASIIPSPTRFKYTFDKSGTIRDFYSAFHRFLIATMLNRQQITPDDTVNLLPVINLNGVAREYLHPTDSVATDSIFNDDPLEYDESDLF